MDTVDPNQPMEVVEELEEAEEEHVEVNRIYVKPKMVYGLRSDVINCIHFNREEEVIYPVEGVIVFQDYVNNTQKYLKLTESALPIILAINQNRKMLAIVESYGRGILHLCVYDTVTLKRKRMQDIPPRAVAKGIAHIEFDGDNRSIALITQGPDELVFILMLDKINTVLETRPGAWGRGSIDCLIFHPEEHNKFLIGGEKLLLFMNRTEKGINLIQNVKTQYVCTSMAFLDPNLVLIGTANNELILYDHWEVKQVQKASEATLLELTYNQEMLNKFLEEEDDTGFPDLQDNRVLHLVYFKKGIAFAIFNRVFVFETISKTKFERKTVITIPLGILDNSLYQISHLAVNLKGDTVIVVPKHTQIYVGILIVPETLKTRLLSFEPLGVYIHAEDVVAVAASSWKKVVVTAGRDKTTRFWNYDTGKVELIRKFQHDIVDVDVNPTGLLIAVAFRDDLRLTAIMLDDLKVVKNYSYGQIRCIRFSNYGHFLATGFGAKVAISSIFSLEVLKIFDAVDTITCLCWNVNDTYLYSGDEAGNVIQWEMKTMTKTHQVNLTDVNIVRICITSKSPILLYAACSNGTIQEFNYESNECRELVFPSRTKCSLTDIVLSRSDVVMFVTSALGEMMHCELPLEGYDVDFINTHFFNSSITNCTFSADCSLLFTVTANGTFAIWSLDNAEERIEPIDQDLLKSHEILIQRSHLSQKNKQVLELEMKLKNQQAEFEFQINQSEINESQQLETVHRTYCQALEELSAKNNEIEAHHADELVQINNVINDLREENRRQLETISNQYSERMLNENQKFARLRDNMLEMRESYEAKLKKSNGTLHDTVAGMENDFKEQLTQRRDLLKYLMKEMQDKKVEFMEYCREVEIENDRSKVALHVDFENKLTVEKNVTKNWMDKTLDLEARYSDLSSDLEKLIGEVESLKGDYMDAKANIKRVGQQLTDVKKDLADREEAITEKERRIQELIHKKAELEKYKLVLEQKILELKSYIEPKEAIIVDKRKHISELENELNGLKLNNTQLELQLNELRDKYISNFTELKTERQHSRAARECIQSICMDIYYVGHKLENIDELKDAVRDLFYKHATDDELKRFISDDPCVRDAFMRQRQQLESVLEIYSRGKLDSSAQKKLRKLQKEREFLEQELKRAKELNEKLKLYKKLKKNY